MTMTVSRQITQSLIDSWMPAFDVAAEYAIRIEAPVERVYDAVLTTDFSRQPVVALLMGLRAIPAFLAAPLSFFRRRRTPGIAGGQRLGSLLSRKFVQLEALPPFELVLGLTGRFWTAGGSLIETDPATFRAAPPPGTARAAWNFSVTSLPDGACRLATETRVRCADLPTARQFRRYWGVVAPGSGLIRWAILRQIRRRAES